MRILTVILIMAMAALTWAQEKETPLLFETFYPEPTVAYAAVSSLKALLVKGLDLPAVKLVEEIVKAVRPDFSVRSGLEIGLREIGLTGDDIDSLFPGPLTIGLFKVEGGKADADNLEWCLVATLSPAAENQAMKIDGVFRRIKNMLAADQMRTREYADYIVTTLFKGPEEVLSYSVFKSYLVVSGSKDELGTAVQRIQEKQAGTFADNELYRRLAGRRARPADVVYYADVLELAAFIGPGIPAEARPYLKYLNLTGLNDVQAIQGTIRLTDTGVSETVDLLFDQIRGIMALFSNPVEPGFDFGLIPETCPMVASINIDALLLWETIGQILKEFQAAAPGSGGELNNLTSGVSEAEMEAGVDLKNDILGNIDASLISFLYPLVVPIQNMPAAPIITANVFDANDTLQNIIHLFKDGFKAELSSKKHGDRTIYYRQYDQMYLAFTFIDERIYASQHPDMLAAWIDGLGSKNRSILDNPKFKAFAGEAGFRNLTFVDIEKYIALFPAVNLNTLIQAMGVSQGSGQILPSLASIGSRLNIYGQKIKYDDNLVSIATVGPVPVQMILPAGLGYLFFVKIPQIPKQREQARIAVSRQRLSTISFNLELYTLEQFGRYPRALGDLYPQYIKTLDVFAAPGSEDVIKFKDEIAQEGMFVLRPITDIHKLKVTDIVVYQKKGIHAEGFHILRRGGAIEFLPADSFDRLQEELEGSSVEIIE